MSASRSGAASRSWAPKSAFALVLLRLSGLRCESGSSMVEMAVILAFLGLPMILGTAQMGLLIYDSIEISNAAHAGAEYGMQSLTFASDTANIKAAAQTEATDFGTSLTATPTTYYACSAAIGGTRYTGTNAQSNANSACTGGSNHALEFIQVVTSASVTPAIHLPGLPSSYTLSATAVMEVEQ
jgi:Flp pilus assembly protein TadG